MLYESGYTNVVIGHAGESSMAINDHYHNIDDDPSNDYIYASSGLPFSVHYKTVNGKPVQMEADYKAIVMDEEWDYIIFYQGPNNAATLVEDQYYSKLDGFVRALKKYSTNPECKILYYMTWAHCVTDTFALYDGIVSVTERLIKQNPNIDGIIPAATLIQNLRTGYLNAGKGGDINRDWGHLNYGVGRYSMALLFYRYLTGSDASEITYIPKAEDIEPGLVHQFTDVESNLDIILECVDNALSTPMKLTQSKYTEK